MITLNGYSLTRIVISEDATELMHYAASELQKYLCKSTGDHLPVVPGSPWKGDFFLREAEVLDDGTYDRTDIAAVNGMIILTGENQVSVLYAVYDFLQRYVGIRFFAAGEQFEYVPGVQSLEFPDELHATFGSAFAIRDFVNRTNSPDVLSFAVKNRINTVLGCGPWVNGSENASHENARLIHSYGLKVRGPGHSWNHFVPDAGEYPAHPEYFPMSNGRRSPNGRTACFSNLTVRRIFGERLRDYLRRHPYWDIFAFWAEDLPDYHYCECPECAKLSTTDWYLTLVNEAAEVVAEELPGALFELIVYQGTNEPPKTVHSLYNQGKNMLVNFCFGQTRDLFHPFEQKTFTNAGLFELYRSWRETLASMGYEGKIMLMEYYNLCEYPDSGPCGRSLMWPLSVMQADIQFYRRDGLDGLGAFTGFDRLCFPSPWRLWAWIRLWSEPWLDLEALKHEFYLCYYGRNAGSVSSYFEALDRVMFAPLCEQNILDLEALEKQLDGLAGERVDIIRLHLKYAVLVKRLHWAVRQDDMETFGKLKKKYLVFQEENSTLLRRMTAPFPMLWFDAIFRRMGWTPAGQKLQWRPGTEGILQ